MKIKIYEKERRRVRVTEETQQEKERESMIEKERHNRDRSHGIIYIEREGGEREGRKVFGRLLRPQLNINIDVTINT